MTALLEFLPVAIIACGAAILALLLTEKIGLLSVPIGVYDLLAAVAVALALSAVVVVATA